MMSIQSEIPLTPRMEVGSMGPNRMEKLRISLSRFRHANDLKYKHAAKNIANCIADVREAEAKGELPVQTTAKTSAATGTRKPAPTEYAEPRRDSSPATRALLTILNAGEIGCKS